MAHLTNRIADRVLEMCNAKFTKNIKFDWSKEMTFSATGTKEECITLTYTIKYGNGKSFEMSVFMYTHYKANIAKPYIKSSLENAKIDLDIARLYKMIKN
jgi:hypothetical protein